jgi:nucleoside 2-deoxyribosyltransferase
MTTENMKMHTDLLVYVAGPYRGDVKRNVALAETNAARLTLNSIGFICPHSNGNPHDHLDLPDQYWIESTLEIMRRCDALLVVGDWAKSEGTIGEIGEARKLGKPIFFHWLDVVQWAGECKSDDPK